MTEEKKIGCTRPAGGTVGDNISEKKKENIIEKTEEKNMIKVGKKAPDFTAPAYHNGQFTSIQLSQFLGKWVVLCCYPGDFTFV